MDHQTLTPEEAAAIRRAQFMAEHRARCEAEAKMVEIADRHGVSHFVASQIIESLSRLLQSPEHRAFAVAVLTGGDKRQEEQPAPTKDDLAALAKELYGETLDRRLSVEKMQARLDELAAITGAGE
jgi:hypothetical protein